MPGEDVAFFPVYRQEKLFVLDTIVGYGMARKYVVEELIIGRPFVAPVRANKIMPEALRGTPHVFYMDKESKTIWLADRIVTNIDSNLRPDSDSISFLNKQTFDLREENLNLVLDYVENGNGVRVKTELPISAYRKIVEMKSAPVPNFISELESNKDGKMMAKMKTIDSPACEKLAEEIYRRSKIRQNIITKTVDNKKRRKRKRNTESEMDGALGDLTEMVESRGMNCGMHMPKVTRGVTKVPGIYYHPNDKFAAELISNGSVKNLGVFDTMREALEAREKAELEVYGSANWVTRTQIIDMDNTLRGAYYWDMDREYYRCAKCQNMIQILQCSSGEATTATIKCLPENEYAIITSERRKNFEAIVKRDTDVILCPCGWINMKISELFHFGINSAHIQEKFMKIQAPPPTSPIAIELRDDSRTLMTEHPLDFPIAMNIPQEELKLSNSFELAEEELELVDFNFSDSYSPNQSDDINLFF
jgi:hypothetical protein